MTLHPRYISDVPEETVKVVKAAFCKGNRYMQLPYDRIWLSANMTASFSAAIIFH